MIGRFAIFGAAVVLGATAPLARAQVSLAELEQAVRASAGTDTHGARLVELAEVQLAQLTVDGADTAALFGVPTTEQEARVREVASKALENAQRAAEAIDAAAARLLAAPDFAADQERQDLRSELTVHYGLIRLPLARARAAALLAAIENDRQRAAAWRQEATAALATLEGESDLIEAQRCALAVAVTRFNPPGADIGQSLVRLTTAESLRRLRGASPQVAREVIIAAAFAKGATTEASAFLHAQFGQFEQETLDGVALRDALALIAVTSRGDLASAVSSLASSSARSTEALAELALRKMERLISGGRSAPTIPPPGRIALARVALNAGDSEAGITALRSAWADLKSERTAFARVAGWSLARALRERNSGVEDIAEAGAVLLEIAARADEPRAQDALATAIGLLEWAARAARGAEYDEIASSLREALRLALTKHPEAPDSDRWRLTLANLSSGLARRELLESIRPGDTTYARARLALAWLAYEEMQVAPSEAQREAAAFTMRQLAEQAQDAVSDAGDKDLASLIAHAHAVALAEGRRLEEALAEALRWDEAGGYESPDAVDLVRRRAATALREALLVRDTEYAREIAPTVEAAGRQMFARIEKGAADRTVVDACAIDLADAIVAMDRAAELDELMAPWRERFGVTRGVGVALATGLQASGDAPQAFAMLRDVVDASRVLELSDEYYWRAWAGLLEILRDQNEDGSRSEAITRQIARLRLEDPDLGGELTKRRIEAATRH